MKKPIQAISLDRRRRVSLQDQLTEELKRRIQSGVISPGESLPSTRELAQAIGVSRNTVIAAYDRLLGEGYLDSHPRSGIRVMAGRIERARQVEPLLPTPPPISANVRLERPVPFHPCQPDVELFPLGIWNRMRNRAMRKWGIGLLDYQSKYALGLPTLRKALADYLNLSRGVRCSWHQIAITNGSQQAIFLLSQLLLKPKDRVLLEDPGYPGVRLAWERSGVKMLRMKVDEHGAVPPPKPSSAKLIYTTPSRQFPTGASLPVARRLAFLELANQSNAWLLEDDYDSEFRYTRPPLPSLHSLDHHGRVIYLGSMSKVLFPSLRIGYVVLPEAWIEPMTQLRLIVEDHGPLIDQATLAEFIQSGAFYSHIRRCRKVYASRLNTFLESAQHFQVPLEFSFTDGGMNQTGLFKDPTTDDLQAAANLSNVGLRVPATNHYAMGSSRIPPGLVFGFTAFDHKTIHSNMAILARSLHNP